MTTDTQGRATAVATSPAARRANPAARILIAPIRFYQRFISPALPATCRYYPTCSAYAVEALQIHGVFRGSWLTLRRLGRCQPWSKREHFDPVPPLTRRELRAQQREQQRIHGARIQVGADSGSASSGLANSGTTKAQGEDQGRAGEPAGPAGSSPSGPRSVPTRRDTPVPPPAIGTIDHPVRRRPA